MERRRILAAIFFSAVVVAVLGALVYLQRAEGQETVSVYELNHTVTAGNPYTSGDVVVVVLRGRSGDFNYERRPPGQYAARYARTMAAGDIVRSDDLVPASATVVLAITVLAPPPLSPGDRVDVFAAHGAGQALIGAGITVLSASGGALTVLVPAADEAAWVAVAAASTPLHVALSGSAPVDGVAPLSAAEAVRRLCGAACAGPPP